MPIYEFFCDRCRTVFNFYSRCVDTSTHPACPRCRYRRMERWVSRFSAPSVRNESHEDSDFEASPGETHMEKALERLAGEADAIPDDDPRQAAAMMRRFSELSGMPLTDGMREALQRLEKGDDPDMVEAELGELLEQETGADSDIDEQSLDEREKQRRKQSVRPIRHEQTLYEMPTKIRKT